MMISWRQTMVAAVVIAFWGSVLAGGVSAAPLPKGICTDPKPYTDLRHCNFERTDLSNKDLRGTDLRIENLYFTDLQGANLTDALVDGRGITYASLEGVIGLPAEALAILKTRYLVKKSAGADIVLSVLPQDYRGDNGNIAGLNHIFLAQTIPGTASTIALLSYPQYGDASSPIFARFEQGKFEFPACYRGIKPAFKKNEPSYYAHWNSLQVRPLKTGGYLIGARAGGSGDDELGWSAWNKVVVLTLSPSCHITRLYEEYRARSANIVNQETRDIGAWCGGELDFRLIDDRTAEIIATIEASTEKECGVYASPQKQVLKKTIPLKMLQ